MHSVWPVVCAALLCLSIGEAHASAGNAHPTYRACVDGCLEDGCVSHVQGGWRHQECETICTGKTDKWLKRFKWNCRHTERLSSSVQADCLYQCMHALEEAREEEHLKPLKYHGKWCFTRLYGMQEVVSVAMSLLNLLAHVAGAWRIFRALTSTKGRYPFTLAWLPFIAASCAAWLGSAAFHSRDVPLTERVDYACAFAVVVASCFAALWRIVPFSSPRWQAMRLAGLVGLAMLWAYHTHYMLRRKFDYGWNMQLCVALGIVQSGAWLMWAWYTAHPGRQYVYLFIVAVNAALVLEVLDFPAMWRLVDAHALWHAATVPLTGLWYSFIVRDVRYMAVASKAR